MDTYKDEKETQTVPTLKDLETALEQRIAKLDEERRENAAQIAKERAAMLELAQAGREQLLEEYKAKTKVREEAARVKAEEEEAKRKALIEQSIAKNQEYLRAEEASRKYQEKLEWLEKAIADAEFTEEQHKKAMDNLRISPPQVPDSTVENPTAPLNGLHPGEAVDDTGGAVEFSSMSQHLKQILRQAQRS